MAATRVAVLLLAAALLGGANSTLPGDDGPCGDADECRVIKALFFEACGSAAQIDRDVNKTATGYVARTASKNATVASLIQEALSGPGGFGLS